MKPFDVLCFQFSMDVEHEEGAALVHHEFLGKGDCREAFICALLKQIPQEGTILVFNMEGRKAAACGSWPVSFPSMLKRWNRSVRGWWICRCLSPAARCIISR